MTNEFLLPCTCGRANPVSTRQAGETIECECGTKLDVPTMRELRRLEPVLAGAGRTKTVWGRRQGLVFLGLSLAVASLAVCGFFYFVVMPPPADFTPSQSQLDNTGALESWRFWMIAREGIPNQPTSDVVDVLERQRQAQSGIRVTLGLAVAGLVLAASGFLVKSIRA